MSTALLFLCGAIPTVAAPSSFPPNSPPFKMQRLPQTQSTSSLTQRRCFASTPFLCFGISGPKDWLKEQKSSKFLLAPVDASRESLRSAYLLLMESDADYTDQDFEEFQNLFSSAARDCVPQERNSFVSFQANSGVEVCQLTTLAIRDELTV